MYQLQGKAGAGVNAAGNDIDVHKDDLRQLLRDVAAERLALLQRHGITVERLQQSTPMRVQAYTIGNVSYSQTFVQRIAYLRANPPGPRWDGAFTFTTK